MHAHSAPAHTGGTHSRMDSSQSSGGGGGNGNDKDDGDWGDGPVDDDDDDDDDDGSGGDWGAVVEADPTEGKGEGRPTRPGVRPVPTDTEERARARRQAARATAAAVQRNDTELGRAWWGGAGPVRGEWRLPESDFALRNPHAGLARAVAAAHVERLEGEPARFVVDAPFWVAATRLPAFDRDQPFGHGGPLANHAAVWRLEGLLFPDIDDDAATVAAAVAALPPDPALRSPLVGAAVSATAHAAVGRRQPTPPVRGGAAGSGRDAAGDEAAMSAVLQSLDAPTREWARFEAVLVDGAAARFMEAEGNAVRNGLPVRRHAVRNGRPVRPQDVAEATPKWKCAAERRLRVARENQVSFLRRLARTTAYLGGHCVSVADDVLDQPACDALVGGLAHPALTPLQCLAARGDPGPLASLWHSRDALDGHFTTGQHSSHSAPASSFSATVTASADSKEGRRRLSGVWLLYANPLHPWDKAQLDVDVVAAEGAAAVTTMAHHWRLRFDRVSASPMRIAVEANHHAFVARALALFGGPFFRFRQSESDPCARPEAYEVLVGVGERGHLAMFQLLYDAYTAVSGDGARVAAEARASCEATLTLAWKHLAHRMGRLPLDVAGRVLHMLFPAIVQRRRPELP